MKPRILVIAGLSLAVVIIAVAVVLNLMTGQPATSPLADSTPTVSSSPTSPAASSATPSGEKPAPTTATPSAGQPEPSVTTSAAEPDESASPASNPPEAAPANPKAPAATPDPSRPLEVMAPAQQATAPVLPKSRTDGPLIKAPLPDEASANGEVVAGFPSTVIPTEPSSAVKISSVSPQDSILQVSLVAHSNLESLAVMQFYQKQFASLGLGAAEAPASAGSSAMWFTRGTDKITVTATPHPGGGTEYSIFGVLHAAS
ncbi:hypothetical protein ART_4028 [Arthrobacter sp. PAMC 25486]|uniref:hypothetical protein n=1 Tax=Arthrobacter sp. PAMC 25486 TaxID=1494608 RepID=UPI000536185D|nr:hypothetical protein [Arthrobacter sp. PAMC 25486]AIY03627.1 hypothetical protein ART_4028 [Arthrobacter sp. PAMC 25486]